MLMRRAAAPVLPIIQKTVNGKDASSRGAFFCCDLLVLRVKCPRSLGAAAVVLRLARDGGDDRDFPLAFEKTEHGWDTYVLKLSMKSICGSRGCGLFYYEYLFLRGNDTLFSSAAEDNVSFTLVSHSASRFRLLVSEDGFDTPASFRGKTMYHIFVDRFAPGKGHHREDAVYHDKWQEEIEQFGAYPGAPVKNNEFFGGTLWGIVKKLDYLESMGVGVLYLSPIFKAASNHKYDTGDYSRVDEQFGGEEALETLLAETKKRGMTVMLDGVFNHTGDDSLYFNRHGNYPSVGAAQSVASPYYDWYYFKEYPNKYECWWDIEILPKLNLSNPRLHNYLVGEGGIIDKYTKMGVGGWRLDVADELPDPFLDELRMRVKNATDGEGVVLGEVWENAADKIAYGRRRRYFQGRQLDSVMNYPLRTGLIAFAKEGNAAPLISVLTELWGSYPLCVCHSLMNILSTHDTERILTVLGDDPDDGHFTNAQLRAKRMTYREHQRADKRLMLASVLQFTVYGVPSVFYGDEAGMEGCHDPFCRRPYPWGNEDAALLAHYRRLGAIRRENPVLADGDFVWVTKHPHALAFDRVSEKGHLRIVANRDTEPLAMSLPCEATELLSGKHCGKHVCVAPNEAKIFKLR